MRPGLVPGGHAEGPLHSWEGWIVCVCVCRQANTNVRRYNSKGGLGCHHSSDRDTHGLMPKSNIDTSFTMEAGYTICDMRPAGEY